MKLTKAIIILPLLALVLTGCAQIQPNKTESLPSARPAVSPQPTPTPSPITQSTGDVDKDLQAIDKEMNSSDVQNDFPDLNPSDLGL